MTRPCLEAALDYLKHGIPPIPIEPDGKAPLVSWSEYQHRLPTQDELRSWWSRWPNAGVGIVTGLISGLVVIDVDSKAGGDPVPILRECPTGRIARTPGGFHLYYKHPGQPVPNCVSIRGRGVDIRGDGGLVVAPPTKVTKGDYIWESEAPAEMAPAWACRRKKQTEDELEGKSWLSDLLSGTTMGKRNESCARIAGYFLKKRIPEDIVQAIMLGWNRRNAEPLEEVEIHKTVRSIYSGKRIGDFAPDARGPWLEALHTFGAKFGDKAIHWLVEGWLPDASIAFCVSPPGSYKTWLVLELAIAVATNTKFLNIAEIHNPGPVLIFQQEDANSMIVDRIALLLASRYETGFSVKDETISISLPARAPIWIHTQRGLHFNDADSLYQLADEIRDKEARLVVIDPLYMAAGSSDGYMQETAQQMAVLKDLRDRYATTFMVVHHTRKTSSGSGGRLDTWGSQFLNAFLETGWQVRPVEYQKKEGGSQMLVPTSGVEVYRHFKSGASDLSSIYLSWNITDSGVEVEVAENVDIINRIEGEKRTSDISILALVVTPNNTMTIARQCKLSPSQTSRRLQRLVTAGLVVKMQDGRWMLSLQGVSKLENNGTSGDDLL